MDERSDVDLKKHIRKFEVQVLCSEHSFIPKGKNTLKSIYMLFAPKSGCLLQKRAT